eukprot:gb/GECG01006269.1/.p1 GENE.gb/GECG01006269.1/~~gb/GECG01006269.1/.p1  ORF type:complete len:105 (+),score=1.64 gb/GECG01006269.1/:1-315(+)
MTFFFSSLSSKSFCLPNELGTESYTCERQCIQNVNTRNVIEVVGNYSYEINVVFLDASLSCVLWQRTAFRELSVHHNSYRSFSCGLNSGECLSVIVPPSVYVVS